MSRAGHWKTHEYKRHSVERDVEEFVGWPLLKEMVSKARMRDAAFLVLSFFLIFSLEYSFLWLIYILQNH